MPIKIVNPGVAWCIESSVSAYIRDDECHLGLIGDPPSANDIHAYFYRKGRVDAMRKILDDLFDLTSKDEDDSGAQASEAGRENPAL
jgi:hypothetical protein